MKDVNYKKNGNSEFGWTIRKMAGSGLNDWRSQSLKIEKKLN